MRCLNEKIYAIAVSVISSPYLNRIWSGIISGSPYSIYSRLSNEKEIDTQEFISKGYSGSPLEVAKRIYDICNTNSIDIIDFWDCRYPSLLREIYKPPIVLYCNGRFKIERSVAVVGTRKSDKISSKIARRIAGELSMAGFTIVSGMAVGIDREAHLGALRNNNLTIGVLANGIDVVYPLRNMDLYREIIASTNSFLLSEYPPGILAGRWTFVRRNRIISGLSLGTVVVKAGKKSGALITARYAVEQNREVFACPGHTFDEGYSGCNDLIRNGAAIVTDTEDILREFPLYYNPNGLSIREDIQSIERVDELSDKEFSSIDRNYECNYSDGSIEKRIFESLADGEKSVDSIIRSIKHEVCDVNEAITMLEISGLIERNGNMVSKAK